MTEVQKSYRKIVYLAFPPDSSTKPVVCDLTRKFDLVFNILKANITPRQEGFLTLEITGLQDNYEKGVAYLREQGIRVTPVAQKIERDEDSCMHCGLCTALCRTKALEVAANREVSFDPEKCTACGLCVKVCPVKAMSVDLENGI